MYRQTLSTVALFALVAIGPRIALAEDAASADAPATLSAPLDPSTLGKPFDSAAFAKAVEGRIWGIDLSHHNPLSEDASGHMADWGISFAILKVTEGIDYKDPAYDAHHAALSDRDIVLGSYHFYVLTDDPTDQAKWFLKNAKEGSILIVDVERAGHKIGPDLPAQVDTFVKHVEKQTGQRVIIYSGDSIYGKYLTGLSSKHSIWVADYQLMPDIPDWSLWQFYDNVHLSGIKGGVDATVFNGNLAAFEAFVAFLRPNAVE